MVHHLGYRIDQLDDQLGHVVTWRRFRTKDKGAWHHFDVWIRLDAVKKRDDVQRFEQLAFVFMQTFNHNIEYRVGIYLHAGLVHDIGCQIRFILPFDLSPLPTEFCFVEVRLQLAQLAEIG